MRSLDYLYLDYYGAKLGLWSELKQNLHGVQGSSLNCIESGWPHQPTLLSAAQTAKIPLSLQSSLLGLGSAIERGSSSRNWSCDGSSPSKGLLSVHPLLSCCCPFGGLGSCWGGVFSSVVHQAEFEFLLRGLLVASLSAHPSLFDNSVESEFRSSKSGISTSEFEDINESS